MINHVHAEVRNDGAQRDLPTRRQPSGIMTLAESKLPRPGFRSRAGGLEPPFTITNSDLVEDQRNALRLATYDNLRKGTKSRKDDKYKPAIVSWGREDPRICSVSIDGAIVS